MGYNVTILCRDEACHQRLVRFMEANRRPWHVLAAGTSLAQDPDYDNSITAYVGKDTWIDNPLAWGFHYNSWVNMPIRSYLYALLDWAALRVGKKGRVRGIRKHVPFICYDGLSEKLPVLLRSVWEGQGHDRDLVDEDGFRPAHRWWVRHPELDLGSPGTAEEKADADLQDKLIKDELVRLSGLWEAGT